MEGNKIEKTPRDGIYLSTLSQFFSDASLGGTKTFPSEAEQSASMLVLLTFDTREFALSMRGLAPGAPGAPALSTGMFSPSAH